METEEQTTTVLAANDHLTSFDFHLFTEGTHLRLYEKLGAHLMSRGGVVGTHFAVWAPNAQSVGVGGDFNGWDPTAHPLESCGSSGVWAGFIPNVAPGAAYRYRIVSWHQGYQVDKTDPVGFRHGEASHSYVWDLDYDWRDSVWLHQRQFQRPAEAPISIYQVHLGSWMRVPEEGNRPLTFREIAPKLGDYVLRLGFTHVELLPVMEHGAAATQEFEITGYFAPDHRYGAPQDLMFLIDYLHQRHIGVILDWVPAHFASDPSGLAYFDGTHLYEHGFWEVDIPGNGKGYSFDFGRKEVWSFLLSSAFFWIEKYHADALRLDSLATMLYLDFGRRPGEWLPNAHGGRENLEAIQFLRQFNTELERQYPGVFSIGQDTSAWPMLTHPTTAGGLGFGCKWDQTFVENTLTYFEQEPFFRKFHHDLLTRRASYAFAENFIVPLSHELSATASLLGRMPGDEWRRFANLRLLYGFLYLQSGKKLLFMGDEFAQWELWNPEASLDWHLCAYPYHGGMQHWVTDLNGLYRREPALALSDNVAAGFAWIDSSNAEQSALSWVRRDPDRREVLLVVCNFTPEVRNNVRVGTRRSGRWRELLNSDAREYGGSGQGNLGEVISSPFSSHGLPHTLAITLPPLAIIVFKHQGEAL